MQLTSETRVPIKLTEVGMAVVDEPAPSRSCVKKAMAAAFAAVCAVSLLHSALAFGRMRHRAHRHGAVDPMDALAAHLSAGQVQDGKAVKVKTCSDANCSTDCKTDTIKTKSCMPLDLHSSLTTTCDKDSVTLNYFTMTPICEGKQETKSVPTNTCLPHDNSFYSVACE